MTELELFVQLFTDFGVKYIVEEGWHAYGATKGSHNVLTVGSMHFHFDEVGRYMGDEHAEFVASQSIRKFRPRLK